MAEQNDLGRSDQEPETLDDEEIIDLTNIVAYPTKEDKASSDPSDGAEESVAGAPGHPDDFSLEFELGESTESDHDGDEFIDSLGMDLESKAGDVSMLNSDTDSLTLPPISMEQIEAALERVIENKLSRKIEHIINEVLERAVTKEMERLKNIFSDEASGEE